MRTMCVRPNACCMRRASTSVHIDRLRGLGRGSQERSSQSQIQELCGRCGNWQGVCQFEREHLSVRFRTLRSHRSHSRGRSRRGPLGVRGCWNSERPLSAHRVPRGGLNPACTTVSMMRTVRPEEPAGPCSLPKYPPPDCAPETPQGPLYPRECISPTGNSSAPLALETCVLKSGFRVFDADLHTIEPGRSVVTVSGRAIPLACTQAQSAGAIPGPGAAASSLPCCCRCGVRRAISPACNGYPRVSISPSSLARAEDTYRCTTISIPSSPTRSRARTMTGHMHSAQTIRSGSNLPRKSPTMTSGSQCTRSNAPCRSLEQSP